MMHTQIENPFRLFWDLGYRNLLPVVPPNAEISPDSNLSEKARGKSPGIRGRDGMWRGVNMHNVVADESDLDRWFAQGAGVGMRGDSGLFFVDVDHMGETEAKRIYGLAKEHLGKSWPRVGQAPKFALPYRSTELVKATSIKFDGEPVAGKEPGLDVISTTPHCVVSGMHATTGQPYQWPKGIPAYKDLTEVTPQQVEAFIDAVLQVYPARSRSTPAAREIPTDQESLRGDPQTLASAMRDMPNSSEKFPDRHDYIVMGLALKSAFGPEYEEEALGLFHQWAARWDSEIKENHAETVEKDWARMHPPYSIGAEFIYAKAEQLTGWTRPAGLLTQQALEYFEPQALEGAPPAQPEAVIRTSVFAPLSILQGLEVPRRDWVVPDLIPDKTVTMLSGDGGTGKSLIAQQLAVSAVLGLPWLGNEVKQGPVLVISAEDDQEELHRRFSAILARNGAKFSDMDQLIFRSLAGEDAVLGATTKNGLIRPTPLFDELEAEANRIRPVLVVLDTLADLFGGSEIDRVQVRQFVGILRGLAIRCETAALLLAHPSVAGMQSGSGTSGSTAWNASVRSRLYLERIVEDGYEPNPDARRLTTKKANYARTGGVMGLTWADGVFEVDDTVAGPLAGVEGNAKAQAVFLKKLEQFTGQGRRVSANPGPSYAPAQFAKAGAEGMTKKALAAAMESLLHAGRIKVERHGSASRSRSHIVLADPFANIGSDGSDGTAGVFS